MRLPVPKLTVLILLAIAAAVPLATLGGCASSTRASTLKAALVTVDASRDAFIAYDSIQQGAIVTKATSLDEGKAALQTYRGQREKVVATFDIAYHAIAAAAVANDDPTLAGLKSALGLLSDALAPLIGGGK